MKKRLCVMVLGCAMLMAGCQSNHEEENSDTSIVAEENVQATQSDLPECELEDADFEVTYEGYTINGQTTAEDIESNLGVPEDFEDNNNGYIATVDDEWRWQLIYPDFTNESDIKVVFYTDLVTDETMIKMVALVNVETYRGIAVGDSMDDVYEAYGLPTEEMPYESNAEYLELDYVKDDQRISFVVDEASGLVKYIYVDYNL